MIFSFYSFLRYYFSRRSAILGIFIFTSTWPISQLLSVDLTQLFLQKTTLLMLWVTIWGHRALTYRSGLIVGLIFFYATCIEPLAFVLIPLMLLLHLVTLPKEKTLWYKLEWLKFLAPGFLLSLFAYLSSNTAAKSVDSHFYKTIDDLSMLMSGKAIFSLSIFGLVLVVWSSLSNIRPFHKLNQSFLRNFTFKRNFHEMWMPLVYILSLFILSISYSSFFFTGFSTMWILTALSIVPIELIFHKLKVYRSKRNMIYLLYILITLLDSQIEMRLRISAKMFLPSSVYSKINKY